MKWSGYVSTTSRAKIIISLLKKKGRLSWREGGRKLFEGEGLFVQSDVMLHISQCTFNRAMERVMGNNHN